MQIVKRQCGKRGRLLLCSFALATLSPLSHAQVNSIQTTLPQSLIVKPPSTSREPLKQPFSSASIWNRPIGKNANYLPANLPAVPGDNVWAGMPQVDEELIVLRPNSPLTPVYHSDAAWTGKNRCQKTSNTVIAQVPVPAGYVVANTTRNNSAVFLSRDGRTLIHMQPFTKCADTTPTALLKFPEEDLYSAGTFGSHGGSGLSAIGGTLRVGELRPSSGAPRHALKINVYAKQALSVCKTKSECYIWPAKGADSYAVGHYGALASSAKTRVKMGALLAIPISRNIGDLGLETLPGKMMAWTLQNYGAYIVDDTWGPGFAINVENGPDGSFREQFKSDWGFDFEQRVRDNTAWVRDVQRLVTALSVITNNATGSVSGGGAPLQPLAAEIAPPNSVTAWKSIAIGSAAR
jgi:hypothetical protein